MSIFDQPESDDFMDSTGAGFPALKFAAIGDTYSGIVRKVTTRTDTKPDGTVNTWDDGSAKKVFIFDMEMNDGEMRTLWVRGNMVKVVRDAASAAGVKTVVGNRITVRHHDLGEAKRGFNPAKLYQAKVEVVAPVPTPAGNDPW